jgi:hypothetical protein
MSRMTTVCEFPFSDLARHPAEVAKAADTHRRVILRRRGAPDLELSRWDYRQGELSQAESFARLLASFLPEVPPEKVPRLVVAALPWTRYLTGKGCAQFVGELPAVLEACADLETLAPLESYLAEWRDTAAAQADPNLREVLMKPIETPLDRPVPEP